MSHSHTNHGERNTRYVLLLTAVVMVIEILSGISFGSMALLADGWHMGTHAAAFCITLFAYYYARKNSGNRAFPLGTGKVSVLGGYTSAIVLSLVALVMAGESINRIFAPETIRFNEAIAIACLGLVVNAVSMVLLREHPHSHGSHHSHAPHDHNLRAAYIHVLADALTSVMAIIALCAGKLWGWFWLDPVMGIVGSLVILKWGYNLLMQTSAILLDSGVEPSYSTSILQAVETLGGQVSRLQIWPVSADHYAVMMTLHSNSKQSLQKYKDLLSEFDKIRYLAVEMSDGDEHEAIN
ncbi:CDF family Co(II)/Ni(II) efflux transporter DmeF [Celerinatantimonas sp. YJH-8]|uniref:CDF family Co(II)/Ni(II) efflux transporter DmeF n=1 Tax=Celerinatantimonas sp. YJH-8 TaxID=3228714 RepID=UPI0038C7EBBF